MMEITKIFSFLVYPGKNEKKPEDIRSTEINLSGKLFEMLQDLYYKSWHECNIPIRFIVPEGEPQKFNEVRTQIMDFMNHPTINNGEVLAKRLRDFTTKVPGLGLLFLIFSENNLSNKLVISRFPADQGILAETNSGNLEIKFIEQIFMKNSLSYKAVLYDYSKPNESDFWEGSATDKQRNFGNDIANYWIRDFLKSDYKTTSIAGTRRFVIALREAINDAKDLSVKQELVGLSILSRGMNNKSYSINEILDIFNISDASKAQFTSRFARNKILLDDVFLMDTKEFISNAPHRSIELNNGAMMLAPTENFDEIITKELVDAQDNRYKISSEGQIVNENLKGK